jgi:hypothetical protein
VCVCVCPCLFVLSVCVSEYRLVGWWCGGRRLDFILGGFGAKKYSNELNAVFGMKLLAEAFVVLRSKQFIL